MSPPTTSHTRKGNAVSGDPLDILETAVSTVLPASFKKAEELNFEETEISASVE